MTATEPLLVVAAVALAWLGLFAHNQLSLPIAPFSLENVGPLVVYGALALWYLRSRGSGKARAALAAWTLLNLVVGGVLTVLPLSMLPFVPEQTVGHYLAHIVYSVAQLPLLVALGRPSQPEQRGIASRGPGWPADS